MQCLVNMFPHNLSFNVFLFKWMLQIGSRQWGLYKMMVALTTSASYFVSKLYLYRYLSDFRNSLLQLLTESFFYSSLFFSMQVSPPSLPPFLLQLPFLPLKSKKKKNKNGCHVLLESWFIKFRQSGALSKSKKAYFKQQYKKMAEKNLSLKIFLF